MLLGEDRLACWDPENWPVEAGWAPVVMGATITVRRWAFISTGEITTQGRVFRISLPTVGSSWASHASVRANTACMYSRNAS